MKQVDFDKIERFDMTLPPRSIKWYLKPIVKLLVNPAIKKYKPEVELIETAELEPPFILLCNHNAFLDFKVARYLLKDMDASYVVAIDGFIGRENLLRNVGCICKRKFTNDIQLVYSIKKSLAMKQVVVIYPEARYSLCGTTAILPESLGKMAKLFKVPIVTLICHGHHVNSPFWDTSHERGIEQTAATFKLLIDQNDIKTLSVDEINKRIVDEFQYDDFKWQKDNNLKISDPNRAKGLHRVLYQCPHCKKEFMMDSHDTVLECKACGKKWEMTELGELKALDGKTEFSHIPDWYEWERSNVRKEVLDGTYNSGELKVVVDTLPNAKKFLRLGSGTLVHDMNGFKVNVTDEFGKTHEMIKDVPSLYSCHIEYQYLFKHGDCIDLNTLTETWYIYPEGENFSVTKMALATEELYLNDKRKKGMEIKKGLA